MIAGMNPELDGQTYRFVQVTPSLAPSLLGDALGTFREAEGVSAIVPVRTADSLELGGSDMARITLQVNSDLQGVGLTAAVSSALAQAGIACNVVAALHHDYLFVPAGSVDSALQILRELQARTASSAA